MRRDRIADLPYYPIGEELMDAEAGGQGEAPSDGGNSGTRPLIAVFNSSDDTVELLQAVLEQEGFRTVVGSIVDVKTGELDFVAFIEHHRPAVIVYDVSLPYEANWNFLRRLRSSEPVKACKFIITTTNKLALDKLVGQTEALEIIGKPYDLQGVVGAVRAALRQTLTS